MCETLDFELEFSARGPLSLGAVGRRRRRISFSVIRRLALVTAVPAVSYRAIASARRRATCARGCLRRVSTLDFRAGIFGPRSFIPWRGWPPPAADFFSVIRRLALVTAVPAVSYRAIASARRRATCARGCLRRVSTLDFRAGIFGPRFFIPWRGWPPPAADFFSVIRRLALVTAVPAVSYRAIASARRRATCARGNI